MNVHCESCETVYRIDPLKVPEGGVRARCTICSNVISVTRSTEDDAPAVSRVRAERVSSQTDRVAHQLGDAFIPAPQDDDDGSESSTFSATDVSVPASDERDAEFDVEDSGPDTRTEEEIAASRRKSVESLPGIIMPPEDDDIPERQPAAPSQPFFTPEPPPPRVDLPPAAAAPPDIEAPRVSRPFSLPRDIGLEPTAEPPAPPPVRPTAPVFRPTPGRPVQAPTTAPPPRPSMAPPVAAPTRPRSPTRPINPFLSRDPGQKARRLARALISDMIVYQPDKRQRALQDGNLAEAFDEEIKKSWNEYVEQVGEELANSTTYFTDALNDLLADGEKVF